MGYAYSANGAAFRAWNDPTNLLAGEVYFVAPPTAAQLTAAFPGYGSETPAQQAAAFLNAGTCAIASASMPAVDGSYAIDAASRATMGEIVLGIQAGDGLPGGGTAFIYDDAVGAHTFAAVGTITAATQFQAVALGVRNAIYAAMQAVQNRTTIVPAQPWPIP